MSDNINYISIFVNAFLAICTIVISIVVYNYSKKANRTSVELGIYQLIQSAKINLDNESKSLIEKKDLKSTKRSTSSIEDEEKQILIINAQIETYLTSLNNACALYYSKDINRDRFSKMYHSDIENIFNNDVYLDLINRNHNYPFLEDFYRDMKR